MLFSTCHVEERYKADVMLTGHVPVFKGDRQVSSGDF